MYLRKLQEKDAPLMLQWMHDKSVVLHMGADFSKKTMDDCVHFISESVTDNDNLHLAVVNENDQYMGTVSLKHIDKNNKTAEFAITVCASAMGKGYSQFGMRTILDKGICELGLKEIFWCVSPENHRAVRFYDKCGYERIQEVPTHICAKYSKDIVLLWYHYTGI